MNRAFAVLLGLALTVAAIAVVAVFWLLTKKPAPTIPGWQANVSIIAGDGSPVFRDSAQSTQAAFADPFGIAVGTDGSIYITDAGESNRIRRVSRDAVVTSLAGGAEGFVDGLGTNASFNSPSGLARDSEGNLYVADTGNNRIRKVTPLGVVSSVAGDGTAGHVDGPADQARFNGPVGVAFDPSGQVYVADTYNDRIRKIATNGEVTTVAGEGFPGDNDGDARSARFDTPCGLVVTGEGDLIVADTGNDRLRKVSPAGQVTTLSLSFSAGVSYASLRRPVGLAITHDGFLYVTEYERSRVVQIAPDGAASVIAGVGELSANGSSGVRFSQLAGIAVDPDGDLYICDSGNYVIRKLTRREDHSNIPAAEPRRMFPRLTAETLSQSSLPWPLDPQHQPHEIAATMGEVRGSFDSEDSRHHLHSGIDIFGAYGGTVRAVRSEKVTSPIPNWAYGDLNEGFRVGVISYIHIRVGRDKDDRLFDDSRMIPVTGDDGKLAGIRIKRGTQFNTGDALGTVNRMYHVHLNVGPPGAEINPLLLAPVGFSDRIAPVIERDGIQLLSETGARLTDQALGRLIVSGRLRIVVDAFDRTDFNAKRRRLGLYRLGYQVLKADGAAVSGFEEPRMTMIFDRLPPDREAAKIVYADESGITVYGSKATRFLYEITNTLRDGHAFVGIWDTSALAKGDYILRIIAADYSGNEAQEGRDLLITVK